MKFKNVIDYIKQNKGPQEKQLLLDNEKQVSKHLEMTETRNLRLSNVFSGHGNSEYKRNIFKGYKYNNTLLWTKNIG